MVDRTDRHFRWLLRRITAHTLLYTPMVVARAFERGATPEAQPVEAYDKEVALQLGGDEPDRLGCCAARAETLGYAEVNLNCGCPSPAALSGAFGAALMLQPSRVAECVAAMRARTRLPVTVKCRIGVDDADRFEDLLRFVDRVASAGCDRFIVHARKAWLRGLSPAQNRTVPPLRHDLVLALARQRPACRIELNGGIDDLQMAVTPPGRVAGVMIGRAAYADPMLLADADVRVFGSLGPQVSALEVLQACVSALEQWVAQGGRPHAFTRHLMGLFRGLPGGRALRGMLAEHGPRAVDASLLREVVRRASARASQDHAKPSLLARL